MEPQTDLLLSRLRGGGTGRMLRKNAFYFVRHGQTDWNAEGLCQGQIDVPLNQKGIGQAHEVKRRLIDTPIATICCSSLGRARQTAEIVNEAMNCPVVVINGLQEISFGKAEGKPLISHSYDILLRIAENHGGESFAVFVGRAIAAINEALSRPGPVLIVSHGGVFCAIQSVVRLNRDGDLTNGVPVCLEPQAGEDCVWNMRSV